jgi:hypothetical protein
MRVLSVLVCIGCIAVAACTSQSDSSTTVSAGSIVEAEWLLHADGPPTTSMDARIEGLVRIDIDAQCVTVETDNAEALVVFNDGALLDISDPERPTLFLRAGGVPYEDGSEIRLGGGFWMQETLTTSQDPAYSDIDIPSACAEFPLWMAARFGSG